MAKILVVVALLLVFAGGNTWAQEVQKDEVPAYLLSILLGYGSGHFYLEDDAAAKFLLLDLGTIAASIAGATVALVSVYDMDPYDDSLPAGYMVGLGITVIASLASMGVRIWEIVDIFRTVDDMKAAGKIAARPVLEPHPTGVAVGVSFAY